MWYRPPGQGPICGLGHLLPASGNARLFADHGSGIAPLFEGRPRQGMEPLPSWWLTNLTHRFSDDRSEQKMKEVELAYVTTSEVGRQMVAEMSACPFRGISHFG